MSTFYNDGTYTINNGAVATSNSDSMTYTYSEGGSGSVVVNDGMWFFEFETDNFGGYFSFTLTTSTGASIIPITSAFDMTDPGFAPGINTDITLYFPEISPFCCAEPEACNYDPNCQTPGGTCNIPIPGVEYCNPDNNNTFPEECWYACHATYIGVSVQIIPEDQGGGCGSNYWEGVDEVPYDQNSDGEYIDSDGWPSGTYARNNNGICDPDDEVAVWNDCNNSYAREACDMHHGMPISSGYNRGCIPFTSCNAPCIGSLH